MVKEIVVFNGVEYRRHPNARQRNRRVYYRAQFRRSGVRSMKYLHVETWRFHNGDIPVGHVIHHADENPLNNDISNLRCMSRSDHMALHTRDRVAKNPEWFRNRVDAARKVLCENHWMRTTEGRKKAREMSALALDLKVRTGKLITNCLHCGESFGHYNKAAKYCGDECRYAAREKRYKAARS